MLKASQIDLVQLTFVRVVSTVQGTTSHVLLECTDYLANLEDYNMHETKYQAYLNKLITDDIGFEPL